MTRIVDHDAEGSIFEALLDAREGDFVTDGFEEVTDLGDEAYRVGTEPGGSHRRGHGAVRGVRCR